MTSQEQPSEPAAINPREISYAISAKTALGRGIIRVIENLSGRLPSLYRIYGYDQDVANGEPFWDCASRRCNLQVNPLGALPETIPASGPAVIISNHPYGIADAMTMGWLLSRRREDFKIVANALFTLAPELAPNILPVDFDPGREAQKRNLQMRRDALSHLEKGGAIGIFPSGAIASAQSPFGYPYDPEWKTFTAKLVASGVPVIPLLFPGRNTMLFEASGWLGPAFRYGLNFFEFNRRIRKPVDVIIGEPLEPAEIKARGDDPVKLMAWMRAQTYELGKDLPYGKGYSVDGPPEGKRWP